ncbi:MAG: deoxyribonuclease IV [Elusimicrobiota bacterium]
MLRGVCHLPNLASSDKKLYKKSVYVLIDELKRCKILNAQYLVIHPGRYSSGDFETGIKNIIAAINFAFSKVKNKTMLLLENLAGGKTDIGWRFEELRRIIDNIKDKKRLGVCLDTSHLFAAGYRISEKGFGETINEFDKIVGLKYLKLLHLNDTPSELGTKIDRHAHIGEGKIGLTGFKTVLNHPELKKLPGIIETPRGNAISNDKKNLDILRKVSKG